MLFQKNIYKIVLSFILLTTLTSKADNKIILDSSYESIVVFDKITYFVDSTRNLAVNDVFQKYKSCSFILNYEGIIFENQNLGDIWFGCSILNNTNQKLNYVLNLPSFDTINVFIYCSDSIVNKILTGNGFSVDQKEIKDVRNLMKLSIDSQNELILIFKISGNFSNIKDHNLKFDIINEYLFTQNDNSERYFQGIFLGVILIMILYNLFLFFSVKHISYLYYVLMLLGSGLIWINNLHYQFEYFITWLPPISLEFFGLVVSAFFGVFLILFTKSFLDTKTKFKKWNIYLNVVILIIVVIPPIPYIAPNLGKICFFASFLSGILAFVSILVISIYAFIKKYRPARYFLLANIFFSFGTIAFILGNIEIIPSNYFTFHGMQFGNIIEIALFSLALADRINILKKENEQNQLLIIQQLTENDKLKDKVNRELEEKVKERTAEIYQQKEEIEAQRDEIEAQRDIVIQQKEQIEEIHQEVTDSINYARRIQEAMLPDINMTGFENLSCFILFRPKDVVSGDFYWTAKINNKLIIAVADCTGHGVPGAFMSMLGISFLNEIVHKQEITLANQILNQLRIEIINALQQKGESGEQKDGMDMSLVVIDNSQFTINNYCSAQFAGANNPLYIVKSLSSPSSYKVEENKSSDFINFTNFELYELKADKMPIAIYLKMDEFTNHEIEINTGDCLYLMSDGYEDQFGGPNGKKFLSKNLKQLLINNVQLSMQEQKEILESTMNKWIGDGEQIDDITIMGIKI